MKPTLDEEIRKIALAAASNLQSDGWKVSPIDFESAIRAGIEAWKRQEPTDEMLIARIDASENGLIATKQGRIITIYRAMMSASLRTSETTGEGK